MSPQKKPAPTQDRWSNRLSQLGVRWVLPSVSESPLTETAAALHERIKELNCLYAIAQLEERPETPLEEFLAMVVDVLPPSLLHPDEACARIRFSGVEYLSLHFQDGGPCLTASIPVNEEEAGEVSVLYHRSMPQADEGPFLMEERHLLNAVADRIGQAAERRRAQMSLSESHFQLLQEQSILRAVLARIEEEKEELRRSVAENVERVLLPILRDMELTAPESLAKELQNMREELKQIASPFIRRLTLAQRSLSPLEVRICYMIRSGMSTKEIARLRGVSPATVGHQRESIRRKLGIAGTRLNLTTFLQSEFD